MRSFTGVVPPGTKTVLSLHAIQTNETRDFAATRSLRLADAASVRLCVSSVVAARCVSPIQPLLGVDFARTDTALSLQPVQIIETLDFGVFC